jgi:hypothetical protein
MPGEVSAAVEPIREVLWFVTTAIIVHRGHRGHRKRLIVSHLRR